MKKLLVATITVLVTFSATACDICGCGVGSYYIGILPDFNQKILGLRYRYNTLRTHIGAGGTTTYLTTEETYRTAELWGGWTIHQKFRIMGYLPVNFNQKHNQGTTYNKSGIGDAGVQGFYQLLNTRKTVGHKLVVQSLWVGAGVKLPTGSYDNLEKSDTETANTFQLGTGSTDVTLNAMYDLRIQDAGINTSASYKVNTANKYDYRYGNKLSFNLQAYYKLRVKDLFTVAPNAGLQYEKAALDDDAGVKMDVSGGRLLLGTLGAELLFKKVAAGANFQTPLSQNLANGFVKANNRAMLHVSFVL
ncbi:transporter [Foetidibacter luteolus]|uniref:transporter n=1 Tax=Foetidibacter luteolus TaxID=2608880 RepID=UPI00129A4498|nr:transporter [Foetidibacter luteolus]